MKMCINSAPTFSFCKCEIRWSWEIKLWDFSVDWGHEEEQTGAALVPNFHRRKFLCCCSKHLQQPELWKEVHLSLTVRFWTLLEFFHSLFLDLFWGETLMFLWLVLEGFHSPKTVLSFIDHQILTVFRVLPKHHKQSELLHKSKLNPVVKQSKFVTGFGGYSTVNKQSESDMV